MSRESSSDSGDESWQNDRIENATDKLREELDEAKRGASGKKEDALEKAREYVDKAEEALRK